MLFWPQRLVDKLQGFPNKLQGSPNKLQGPPNKRAIRSPTLVSEPSTNVGGPLVAADGLPTLVGQAIFACRTRKCRGYLLVDKKMFVISACRQEKHVPSWPPRPPNKLQGLIQQIPRACQQTPRARQQTQRARQQTPAAGPPSMQNRWGNMLFWHPWSANKLQGLHNKLQGLANHCW